MSNEQCRRTCDVYADWLKAGETITELEAKFAQLHESWEAMEDYSNRQKDHISRLEAELAENEGLLENYADTEVELKAELAKQSLVSEFYLEGIELSQAEIAELKSQLARHEWVDIKDRPPDEET